MKKLLSLFVAALFSVAMFAADEQKTYTVAGDNVALFGAEWDAENTANDLQNENGVWLWRKAGVVLEAGNIEYKIVLNHAWEAKDGGGCWPTDGNRIQNVGKKARYDVTVEFHEDTHAVGMVLQESEDQSGIDDEPASSYFMKNCWAGGEWEWKSMTQNPDDENAYLLENVVFGGGGVNVNTVAEDNDDKEWYEAEKIRAFLESQEEATLEKFDTVTFLYFPKENENKVQAMITGKYNDGGQGGGEEEQEGDFYLVGSMNNWSAAEGYKFDVNPDQQGEYILKVTLNVDDQIKVAKSVDNQITTWYPDGMGNELKIDKKYAGEKTIYFHPNKNAVWTLLEGYIYIEPNEDEGGEGGGEEESADYYMKNCWAGGEWEWKPMAAPGEEELAYKLENVVFGGVGVNVNTVAEDNDDKEWYEVEKIIAFLESQEAATLEKFDTVTFFYFPTAEENKVQAMITGKYNEGGQGGGEEESKYEGKFYITGESLVGSWNPDALEVTEHSHTFTALAAGDYEFKVTLDGDWNSAKGFSDLTEQTKGLWEGENNNICFSLAAAGDVTVTYFEENGQRTFKVEGTFDESKVPVIALADGYYLIGKPGWSVTDLDASYKFEPNGDVEGEYKLNILLAVGDPLKVVEVKDAKILTWFPDGMGNEFTVDADHAGQKDIFFRPAGNEEWAEFVEGGYFFIEDNGGIEPQPEETNYFLVGSFNNWLVGDVTYQFSANPDSEGEYVLEVTLHTGDQIKIVGVNGETQTWFPDGMGNDFTVSSELAGKVAIYFRPAGNEEWAAIHEGGFFFIEVIEPEEQAIDNTAIQNAAVKFLENGQLIILKNGIKYNANGAVVK